jgi:hypothetical protein
VELGARDVQLRLGLIANDQPRWELAGESSQKQRRKIAISRAKLQNGALCDTWDARQDALVEDIALERAAMMSGDAVPLAGDAIIISDACYRLVSSLPNHSGAPCAHNPCSIALTSAIIPGAQYLAFRLRGCTASGCRWYTEIT